MRGVPLTTHGGFLGGYSDFYKGSKDNPADSFSERYQEDAEDILTYRPGDAEEDNDIFKPDEYSDY